MLLPTPGKEHPCSGDVGGAGAEGSCGGEYGRGLSHQHGTTNPGTGV